MASSTIKYGVYDIDSDYIYSLIKNGIPAADPSVTHTYIGPVAYSNTDNGLIALFVPVDPAFDTCSSYIRDYNNGNAYGFLDFTKMISVPDNLLSDHLDRAELITFAAYRRSFLMSCAEHAVLEFGMTDRFASNKES